MDFACAPLLLLAYAGSSASKGGSFETVTALAKEHGLPAICVIVLGWVLRGTLPAMYQTHKDHQKFEKEHELEMKKLSLDIERRDPE